MLHNFGNWITGIIYTHPETLQGISPIQRHEGGGSGGIIDGTLLFLKGELLLFLIIPLLSLYIYSFDRLEVIELVSLIRVT